MIIAAAHQCNIMVIDHPVAHSTVPVTGEDDDHHQRSLITSPATTKLKTINCCSHLPQVRHKTQPKSMFQILGQHECR
jgi:hypothetical protein